MIYVLYHCQEKSERQVTLKAMGNAISKAVTVAEILKHRVPSLHQVTRISSIDTVDVYEPLEEGLDRIETTRHIPGISIQLSLDELDRDDPGYQSPIPLDQVTASSPSYHDSREFRKTRGHSRRSGRNAGRGDVPAAAEAEEEEAAEDAEAEAEQTPGEEGLRLPRQPRAESEAKDGVVAAVVAMEVVARSRMDELLLRTERTKQKLAVQWSR